MLDPLISWTITISLKTFRNLFSQHSPIRRETWAGRRHLTLEMKILCWFEIPGWRMLGEISERNLNLHLDAFNYLSCNQPAIFPQSRRIDYYTHSQLVETVTRCQTGVVRTFAACITGGLLFFFWINSRHLFWSFSQRPAQILFWKTSKLCIGRLAVTATADVLGCTSPKQVSEGVKKFWKHVLGMLVKLWSSCRSLMSKQTSK